MSSFEKRREFLSRNTISPPFPLYEKEFPLIFFWSPKAGCTSLIKWFYFQIGILQRAMNYHPWVHRYRMEVFEKQKKYLNNIKKEILTEEKEIYKLTRDPYTRAVSSFLATINNKSIMKRVVPEAMDTGLSFKQFLYMVKKTGVSRDKMNLHIAQQYIEEEEIIIQNYLRLENFNTEIKEIEKKYKLIDAPIKSIVQSPHHKAQKMIDKGVRSFSEVIVTREELRGPIPGYRNFYDQETKDLVIDLFKKDFIKYGYKQDLN